VTIIGGVNILGMVLSWIGTLIVTFGSIGIAAHYDATMNAFAERSELEVYFLFALPIIIYVLMAVCSLLIYKFGVTVKLKKAAVIVPALITLAGFVLGIYHRFWPFPIFQNGVSYAFTRYYTYLLLQVFPLTSLVAVMLQQRKSVKNHAAEVSSETPASRGQVRYIDAADLDIDGSVMAICHREYELEIIGTTFYVVMTAPEDLEFVAEAKEKYGIIFVAAKSDEDWKQPFFTVPWMSIFARDAGGYYALKGQKEYQNVYYIDDDRNTDILGCNFDQFIAALRAGEFEKMKRSKVPYFGIDFYDAKEAAAEDYMFLEK